MDIKLVAQVIKYSSYCVVVTGAGISTGAGLPDYRSSGGRWYNSNPIEVCSTEANYSSEEFVGFWKHMVQEVQCCFPTKAHDILEDWLDEGIINNIVTQNIDGYHGKYSEVLEVHGSIHGFLCEGCSHTVGSVQYLESPVCPQCGKGYLRPQVVFFGENVGKLDDLQDILWASKERSVLVIIGTSLEVDPLKTVVQQSLSDYDHIIVVNNELPHILEGEGKVVHLQGDIQDTMTKLQESME